ncbi:DinB family protein [Flavobacterium psychrophilum]|nr:DinB family protein [Flavobacterium psychrophilum]
MSEGLKKSITETFSKLNEVLSSFSEMNKPEANNSWTVGQIAEHLTISNLVIIKTLNGTSETVERSSDEKVQVIKDFFLDFPTKMKAPDFIQPSSNPQIKADILVSIQNIKNEFLEIAEMQNLELICLDFEIPTFGKFTKYEWVWWAIFHTQRHIYQLGKLKVN